MCIRVLRGVHSPLGGVGQLVQHDHLVVGVLDEMLDDVVADEAAPAGDDAALALVGLALLVSVSFRVVLGLGLGSG